VAVERIIGATRVADTDRLAAEAPLEIRLGYSTPLGREQRPISITMRTPGHDVELAVGFLFTEGIVTSPEQVRYAAPYGPPDDAGLRNVVQVELEPGVELDIARLARNFYTTSSCGVCGKASLEALRVQACFPIAREGFSIARDVLFALPDRVRERQKVFGATGGLHASALFDAGGTVMDVREDVGRHNALDKLAGGLALEGLSAADGMVLLTSRVSVEMVQKAASMGAPLLVAISAPTALAVRMADAAGITLCAIARADGFETFTHPQRVENAALKEISRVVA
jgi:FdhD protein